MVGLSFAYRLPPLKKTPAGICYATVGVHPCSSQQLDKHPKGPQGALAELKALAIKARDDGLAVAFGEIGLDYDRLFLAPKETQLKCFEAQLDLATELEMPLFLHSRACSTDFEGLLQARLERLPKRGLVHSFTGTIEEMRRLVDMGFDIGINGCSMKTEENLAVVKEVPLDRLQIETDGPWVSVDSTPRRRSTDIANAMQCEIRASHASSKYLEGAPELSVKAVKKEKWEEGLMVKGRNEPVTIARVAHVIAAVKGVTIEELTEA